MKKIMFYVLLIISLSACIKSKKQKLEAEQQKTETEAINTVIESEVVLDTVIPTPGIKYKENKRSDSRYPLVNIDLTAQYEDKELDLANYYSSAKYIKVKHPFADKGHQFMSDVEYSISYNEMGMYGTGFSSSVNISKDKIIAGDQYVGYYCFDDKGNYLYPLILPDDFPEYDKNTNTMSLTINAASKRISGYSSLGANYLFSFVKKDKSYFLFHNTDTQKNFLTMPFGDGVPSLIDDKSFVLYRYNPLTDRQVAYMYSFAFSGDTLCSFMNYNPIIEDVKRRAYTNPERVQRYYLNNTLTIRQAYNDTIYRMTSASRLIPVFCLDMKNKKPDMNTVLYGDKAGKLFVKRLLETNDFLYIIFTENYDCPNNRNNKTVKFSYVYYDKKERRTYQIKSNSFPEDQIIKNSMEDALPVSIGNISIGDNILYSSFTKKRLGNLINSSAFKKFSDEQQNKIKLLHEDTEEDEMLIMILE